MTTQILVEPSGEAALHIILNRCDWLAKRIEWPGYTRTAMMMDIEFVNQDCVPLDLPGLALARDGDFVHDVIGIWNNYNRVSGLVENCFLPRFSKHTVSPV